MAVEQSFSMKYYNKKREMQVSPGIQATYHLHLYGSIYSATLMEIDPVS
jgi:hypothetical protein